ncbi:2-dehydro-3-deoxygalactonokinase [Tabrizicola sp. J26]|uniref:2-dehydro-3-deoxygalactonokinase n=1 Tax=Alitabrizicola rongguiensis TaxID=2909234 RepID=UPI001F22689B|nr:2-dehydro-3-deoxygalactonokinase [Tabrizicola rongguiensis]MCF1711133.1 2-dehydro-3-deoxygalactonokinase [Tabrizicola rongguiensis]
MSDTALIAIDWGTTSFRAWKISAAGEAVGEIITSSGILSVKDGAYDAVFEGLLGEWLDANPGVPVIASGMITSRTGWVETTYAPLPTGVHALAGELRAHVTSRGRVIHFVTGTAVNPADGLPDVMRGEETEVIGHLAASEDKDALIVLPGTHSKWVHAEKGVITGFETFMTGELYAVLLGHSILGRLMADGPSRPESFRDGVEVARTSGSILGKLFSARSKVLFNRLRPDEVAEYLSGMLIGEEVRTGLTRYGVERPITVVGRGDLAERYLVALTLCGARARTAEPGMARHGLYRIAQHAGLVA